MNASNGLPADISQVMEPGLVCAFCGGGLQTGTELCPARVHVDYLFANMLSNGKLDAGWEIKTRRHPSENKTLVLILCAFLS